MTCHSPLPCVAFGVVSLACLFRLASVAGGEAAVGSRYALLVAVDDYIQADKLKFCGADMQSLAQQLAAAGFSEDHLYLLHDRAEQTRLRPIKSNIQRELRLVLSLAEKQDLVIVAFSGHGIHRDGKSYLCPADARLDDPETLVPLDWIYQQLQESRAALKLILIDACRNDPRPPGRRSAGQAPDVRQFAESLVPPQGILLLNSCAPGEVSIEDKDLGHGVFMHSVLEGLRGKADANGNGRVSFLELCLYANDKTKNHVARKFAEIQRPSWKGEMNDDFEITSSVVDLQPVVSRSPTGTPIGRSVSGSTALDSGDETGFVSLFDGQTLNGWQGDFQHHVVENGCIVADFGGDVHREVGSYLFTQRAYANFVLRLQYRITPGTNNGILIRAATVNPAKDGFEVQILDDDWPAYANLRPWQRNAAVWNLVAPRESQPNLAGRWNDLEISFVGRDLRVILNRRTIIDTNLDDPRDKVAQSEYLPGLRRSSGHIGFNGDFSTGRAEFRYLRIREVP